MKIFLCAIAISLILEGIGFALFPALMRDAMREASSMSDNALRKMGAWALAAAIVLLYLASGPN